MDQESPSGSSTPYTSDTGFKPPRIDIKGKTRSFGDVQEEVEQSSVSQPNHHNFNRLKTHRTDSIPQSPLKHATRTPPVSPNSANHRLPHTPSQYRFRQQSSSYYNQPNSSRFRRLRRPSSSFIELSSKIENGYRKFMPINALSDPGFVEIGDTVKETHKIFEILYSNLQFYGQSFVDIAHLQIYLTKQDALEDVEEAINFHLRGHYPPINVIYTDGLQNQEQCTIQVIATCFYNPPHQFTQKRVTEHDSFGNMSNNDSYMVRHPTNLPHYNTTPQHMVRERPGAQYTSNPLAELLPISLAIAFGYLGSSVQRLRICMIIVTSIRGLVSLIGIADLALLFSTASLYMNSLRLENLSSSFEYFLTVGLLCTISSMLFCAYGLLWLYYNTLCLDKKTYIFNTHTPKFLQRYFKRYCQLGYYLDKIQVLLLLSSTSSVFAITALISLEDGELKRRLLFSATLGIISFFVLLVLTKFNTFVLNTYKSMNYQLPITTINNETQNKKNELVKFLTGKQSPQSSHSLAKN